MPLPKLIAALLCASLLWAGSMQAVVSRRQDRPRVPIEDHDEGLAPDPDSDLLPGPGEARGEPQLVILKPRPVPKLPSAFRPVPKPQPSPRPKPVLPGAATPPPAKPTPTPPITRPT